MFRLTLILSLTLITTASVFNVGSVSVSALECKDNQGTMKWTDKGHGDEHPSSKEGKKMIEQGASVCQIAKACDHMKIDIAIKNEKELIKTDFYQNAPTEIQKELREYAQHGNGHDSPNIVCYEIEKSIDE